MAIDVSEGGHGYYDLENHIGHEIVIVGYGKGQCPDNISIECITCGEVLVDFDRPFYDREHNCLECGMETYIREDTGEVSCSNESCENATADWGSIGEPS
jgi:hypothetical protein